MSWVKAERGTKPGRNRPSKGSDMHHGEFEYVATALPFRIYRITRGRDGLIIPPSLVPWTILQIDPAAFVTSSSRLHYYNCYTCQDLLSFASAEITMSVQPNSWPFDLAVAQQLGFVFLAVGGSRAYHQKELTATGADHRDWDLIGVVKSKNDIVSLVLYSVAQLNALLGITKVENVKWQKALSEGRNEEWEVLRFSGWAQDSSKRSLKICSQAHLFDMAAHHSIERFGVLSARAVRHCRRYHPSDGHRIFAYQPLRLTEDLYILHDADFIHPDSSPTAINPGVTCDLLLTSVVYYDSYPDSTKRLISALLRKWKTISKADSVLSIMPLFYRYLDFDDIFSQRLRAKLSQAVGLPLLRQCSPQKLSIGSSRDRGVYHDLSFLPLRQSFWMAYQPSLELTEYLDIYEGPIEYRQGLRHHHSSPFTTNSEGSFGEIRFSGSTWKSAFVKTGPYVKQELSILPDIQRYFRPRYVQQLIAVNIAARKLFFRFFRGKLLNELRLEFYTNRANASNRERMDVVDQFLDIELRRAEQVTDAYRRTINMSPDTVSSANQGIHRFYYERLKSDSRFIEFYGETIPSICANPATSVSHFLSTPLIINGALHLPLRHYLDHAQHILSPHARGGLESLPIAFGLGDGHGGNVMVNKDNFPAKFIHIDYEVSGFHCPFLDMAKALYNDGFFNVLYGDLLCQGITNEPNASGTTVSWAWGREGICIDCSIKMDEIGKVTAVTKLEYILRPLFELVAQHSSLKAKLAEDVLGNALFTCALLTRNFSERPDLFFLNLALGIRLASSMRDVFYELFRWRIISIALSSNLMPDEVFLKRANETFELQKQFSQEKNESSGAILQRIARIAPHTCIRESIFAESRIDNHFAYENILGSRNPTDQLVDVGCCMGTDIRKLILDGYRSDCILGLDIEKRFFDLGNMLYNKAQQCFKFRHADMLDINFADKYSDLEKKFQFIHTANVLHLFSVKEQDIFFRNLIYLAKPGGIIWGRQVGLAANNHPSFRQPEGKGY
ncbi:hypothetical protein H105_00617 [Trichophyton soudanense CBS 452.61]|uniref:Methyltransferase domain-containing protein n=1 Tax=Trichophyton soudanense CBS 452.61 TaxID=1215331 RepID=A0A022Y6B1_TRISD|nr:hypothetical protein H105_00617 [Trichophyton soudanense CBS 452.61]